MRKIILSLSMSLDGFMAGPDGDISWHRVDEELHDHMNERLAKMGAFLNGRVNHELMASVWPAADQDSASPRPMREFARIWLDMPKYVYSRTLDVGAARWNTAVVRDVVPDEVRALKALPGGDMVVGGPDLAATFLRHGLIDDFTIYVHPVVIGRGRPLFPDVRLDLEFVGSQTFGNGVVLLRYQRPHT